MFRNPLNDALVVLVILLLFFGPKRLPMLSRSIGESIKEFRGGINSSDEDKPQLEKSESTQSGGEDGAREPAVPATPVRDSAESGAEHHV